MKRYLIVLAALAAALAAPVWAQNTIDFDVSTSTGNGQVTTTATWSTTPAAQSCDATGAPEWAGTKAASGTQDLTLTASVTLNLRCTWPGTSIVEYSWTNATQNTDGSPYTDPKFVRIKQTFDAAAALTLPTIACGGVVACFDRPDAIGARPTMHTVTGITQIGTLRAAAFHVNQLDAQSGPSNAVSKVFTGLVTVTESIGITVNAVPGAPSGFQGL
jgi:hypothetical protein